MATTARPPPPSRSALAPTSILFVKRERLWACCRCLMRSLRFVRCEGCRRPVSFHRGA
ncbi:hypothetical protein EST54_03330 [Streptomyces sioyaensis]|uniref:Uncharacterized protein n=1 Tax=Streptomyces sioyaensis TaxID=67364 RepID=A0A4Q1RAH2_9ACTN|nr:hypothetical protein EST54_03330 [Streptomyces sioyaensis]